MCSRLVENNKQCTPAFVDFARLAVLKRWQRLLPTIPSALRPQIRRRMKQQAARAGAELKDAVADMSFTDTCEQLAESRKAEDRKKSARLFKCADHANCSRYVRCFMAEAGHLVGYRTHPVFAGGGKGSCRRFCAMFKQCFWTVIQVSGKMSPSQLSLIKRLPKSKLDQILEQATRSCTTRCNNAQPSKQRRYIECSAHSDCTSFAKCGKQFMK